MPALSTPVCEFGWKAQNFSLQSTRNEIIELNKARGQNGTLIMFICNHCPYVIHYHGELQKLAEDYQDDFNLVAISSNDIVNYPQDAPDKMNLLWNDLGLSFPYLFDENQEIAKKYKAECTPEFYLFDKEKKLVYRGRFDATSPGSENKPDGSDLRNAMQNCLDGNEISGEQHPSMGCNIKWID